MNWSEEQVAELTRLWNKGEFSAREIARKMSRPGLSITGNMVIGKARRLKLQPRPSPIKHKSPVLGHGLAVQIGSTLRFL